MTPEFNSSLGLCTSFFLPTAELAAYLELFDLSESGGHLLLSSSFWWKDYLAFYSMPLNHHALPGKKDESCSGQSESQSRFNYKPRLLMEGAIDKALLEATARPSI